MANSARGVMKIPADNLDKAGRPSDVGDRFPD